MVNDHTKICQVRLHIRESGASLTTGSDGNLLPLKVYLSLFPQATQKSLQQSVNPNASLHAYNGTEIQQLGRCKLHVAFKG